jgi:transcriptional regulator with XRE-family HTH domain
MQKMQNNIANTLRFLRKEQKMTLVQLAQKTGVNTSSLSRIERGEINITVDLLGRIAKALNTYFF